MKTISLHHLYKTAFRNLANVTSILGVLPLFLLLGESGGAFLVPLIIYCNVMDDLDGILAVKLKIGSEFGARLDNVCDSISHSMILMFVGMSYGGVCMAAALIAISMVVIRSVSRLDPNAAPGVGSPTNELVRHVLFILLLSEQFGFGATPYLVAACAVNSFTMAFRRKMPFMIRSMAKSAVAVGAVNVALVVAWLVPNASPLIATAFIGSYFYSLGWAILRPQTTSPAELQ